MEDVLSRMQKAVEQDKVETLVMTVSKVPFEKLALATENRERFKKWANIWRRLVPRHLFWAVLVQFVSKFANKLVEFANDCQSQYAYHK